MPSASKQVTPTYASNTDINMQHSEVIPDTQMGSTAIEVSSKGKTVAVDQRMKNTSQKSLSNTFQMGPFVNRSITLMIFDVGPVQKHPTQMENGFPIILKKVTTQNVTVAASITEQTSTEPDYAQLCTPITNLGELPDIDLSTFSLNTQPILYSFGSYNVTADSSLGSNDVRNNSPLNASGSSLNSSQSSSQNGDGSNASLGGGSGSSTQHGTLEDLEKNLQNKELSMLCRNVNPDINFISETKMGKDMAARKLKNMGFPCTCNVPSVGRSGGLYPQTLLLGTTVSTNYSPIDESVFVIGSPAYKLKSKLLSAKKGLRDWNKSSFGNIQTDISTIRKDFLELQISDPTDSIITARLKTILEYLYTLEELYWKDTSREVWLIEGDRNTPYFHRVTLFRRKRNAISWIKDSSNAILTHRDSIWNSFLDYFKNLYSSQPQQFQDEILNDLPVKFSAEDNDTLNLLPAVGEIKNVVFQMGGKKTPGPDCFTGLFYQNHWDILGEAVVDMTQTCFRTGHIAKVFNHTNIALIPKVPLAELVSQYKPLGLCNFIYKILSKTLANRLKPFMNNIISQNQSAFIPKRSISDNILLANEAIYSVNHNDKVEGTASIKLDMSKAYDKLEWSFLEKVLRKMDLAENWIKLINQCVSTISYSVLLNGSPTGFFQPERGLRQGDPLSPYIYIICVEDLSSYIDSLQRNETLKGIKICKNAPEMTHLLFADDSLLFSSATTENFTVIKGCLQKYCLASRQEINFDKSDILFSRKIPEHRKALLANILDIQSRDLGEKYLVTPTILKASRIQTYMGILQAMDARITVWLHKLLSQAARTTLVKHIGQAIPLKAELNNLAMLARNAWKIIENPDCMLAKILKVRYFPRTDFLNANCPDKFSWTWKCLHAIKELIKPFFSWIVGDGKFIGPWCDKWIPNLGSGTPNPPTPQDPSIKVDYFIDNHTITLNVSRLFTHFDDASAKNIVTIPLSQHCTPNRRDWDLSKNGKFSLKSAYLGLRGINASPCKNLWLHIWKTRVPHRIQLFLWEAAKTALPARTVIHTRMPMHSVECPDARILMKTLCILCLCVLLLLRLPDDAQQLFVAILWFLWTSRNNLVFRNVSENHKYVIERAREMLLTRKNTSVATLSYPIALNHKWMPPLVGWIKCNTDGDFDNIYGDNGVGYVMRNSTSKASFCAAVVFEVSSAEEAEARAIWGVLKKAVEQKMTHIIIQSDAKKLVEQFSLGSFDGDSRTNAILKDIQLFASNLIACIFSFQPRICNTVDHELAQWAKRKKTSMYWSMLPAWLDPAVEGDY
ncbi:uncharacterized protein LOC113326320 [Papaver somniferum]|uniref:uncharacterized protein LOC113326320 n=1 Tax=Papaver somniferum TaxID=3469 RepID=UPI000E704C68|nr:uncharacterized protein LOC113326320 [Papaver somniferum]